jgi:hypothetical protein
MGAVTFGIPMPLVEWLARPLALQAAVETGTYRGDSAVALRKLFPRVWTIELSEELYEAAKVRYGTISGLTFVHGPSPEVLSDLAPRIGPALYWLDAHWSEGETAGREGQCPVLAEIEAIDASSPASGESCLLIDDARFFLLGPTAAYRPEDWPTYREINDKLCAVHDRYVTVLEDVIIAGPPLIGQVVDDYWSSVLQYRFGPAALDSGPELEEVLAKPFDAYGSAIAKLVELLGSGVDVHSPTGLGGPGRLARRLVRRMLRNVLVYQNGVDRAVLEVVGAMDNTMRELVVWEREARGPRAAIPSALRTLGARLDRLEVDARVTQALRRRAQSGEAGHPSWRVRQE